MMRFLAFIAIVLLSFCRVFPAQAGEALVTSEASVDVVGKDAVDARNQAMAKGQADALLELLGKLAPPGQAQEIIVGLDVKKIAALVRGVEVLDEKISGERYRARLLVSFDADGVSALIGKFGADSAKDDTVPVAGSFLVIPAYEEDSNSVLWEDSNPWATAWRALGLEITTGDVIVPFGDSKDAGIVDTKTLPSATFSSLSGFALRYGITDIVILQAKFVRTPDMLLTVVKRRINRATNEVNILTFRADPQETRDVLFARAARDIVDGLQNKKLEELSTNRGGTKGGERNKMMMLATITTMNSWTAIRSKLSGLPMIDRVEILALSSSQVDMVVHYRGAAESLARAIAAQQLRLVQNKDYWVISRD